MPDNKLRNTKFGGHHNLDMWGELTGLVHLNLSGNELGGGLPAELDQLTNLTHLNLSGNSFRGDIRGEGGTLSWENLKKLVELDLSWNKQCGTFGCRLGLSGRVPAGLGTLPDLALLNVAGNELTGGIRNALPDSDADSAIEFFWDDNDWKDEDAEISSEFNGIVKAIAKEKVEGKLEEAGLDLAGRVIEGDVVLAVAQRGADRGVRATTKSMLRVVPVVGQAATAAEWIGFLFLGGANPYLDYIDLFIAGAHAVYNRITSITTTSCIIEHCWDSGALG